MQKFRSFPLILWLFLLFLSAQAAHGADATSFDPTKVAVKAQGSGGVPVGTIVAWPVATKPDDMDNWLECNGQSISRSVYPELFALVGGQVPDLRGLFLRGHGGNSAGLGEQQGHATKNYNGVGYIWTGFGADLRASGAFVWNSSWGISAPAAYGIPVANEVRPDNQAVRYLIRAMP